MLHTPMKTQIAIDPFDAVPQILRAAGNLGFIGANSATAGRLLAALCNPIITFDELSKLLNSEPALVVRILRVANSAFYGVSRSIKTIDRALMVLGFDSVRAVAAAACLDRGLARATHEAALDHHAMVRHSVTTAVAAEAIAKHVQRDMAGDAFIAGLLHNLGLPVQAVIDPAGLRTLSAALRAGHSGDFRQLERSTLRLSHEECAAVVFEQWQLPDSLVEVARWHHAPLFAPAPHKWLAAVLGLALGLAAEVGHGFELEPTPQLRDPELMYFVGVTNENLDAISDDLIKGSALLRLATGD